VINALIKAYESCKDRFDEPITFDEFSVMFADWECISIEVNGDCAGALMCKDHEIHACILPKYFNKWLSKKVWRSVFVDRLNKYGYLQTGVTANNEIGKRFVERCGFKEYDRFANVVIYRLGG
jgi:ribosomal protein S18 acetylase RimI-like enzyme